MKEALRQYIQAFGILTANEIQLILDNTSVKSFEKGTVLLEEGQIASKCYLILKGSIREYQIKNGIDKTTGFYMEGDSVASFSSTGNKVPSKHFLQCEEDCITTVSNQNIEKEMCRQIPRLESIILSEVEKTTGKIQDELSTFITSSPEERYVYLLNSKPEIFNRFPQHQIASYIGVKPESLSRIRRRIHARK